MKLETMTIDARARLAQALVKHALRMSKMSRPDDNAARCVDSSDAPIVDRRHRKVEEPVS
jgi:hypothetical protein